MDFLKIFSQEFKTNYFFKNICHICFIKYSSRKFIFLKIAPGFFAKDFFNWIKESEILPNNVENLKE